MPVIFKINYSLVYLVNFVVNVVLQNNMSNAYVDHLRRLTDRPVLKMIYFIIILKREHCYFTVPIKAVNIVFILTAF